MIPASIEAQEAIHEWAAELWLQAGVSFAESLPVSSPYGVREHPVDHVVKTHHGLDIAVPVGSPVMSLWRGLVVRVDRVGVGRGVDNGNAVFVQSGPFLCGFLHLSRADVSQNQAVKWGQVIGLSGATGKVNGPHLHLAVNVKIQGEWRSIDPSILYPRNAFHSR